MSIQYMHVKVVDTVLVLIQIFREIDKIIKSICSEYLGERRSDKKMCSKKNNN